MDRGQPHRFSPILFLVLGLANISFVKCLDSYLPGDLYALQKILAAWSATPDLEGDLNGWSKTHQNPCSYQSYSTDLLPGNDVKALYTNWRGVQCVRNNCTQNNDCFFYVVSLSISSASIVGTLPLEIANMTWMSILELTGNPNLTGQLPKTIANLWLSVLDVHDNGFNGAIPDFRNLTSLLRMDLSGNKFTGEYPSQQLQTMENLQTLSVSGNDFYGNISMDAFTRKHLLERLDISNNHFNGTLPQLDTMNRLEYLDVSRNEFAGNLPNLLKSTALRTANFSGNNLSWTGQLQDTFNLTAKLTKLDLSHNNLSGYLPLWNRSSLGSLQELYMHNNSLTGTLDIFAMNQLGLLRGRSENSTGKLEVLSLSNNSITHVIYSEFIIQHISTIFKLDGNPVCRHYDAGDDGQRCFCTQICFLSREKTNSRRIIIIAATSSVLSVILIVAVVVGAIIRKNRRYKQYLQLQFSKKFNEYDVKPTIFSYTELRAATRDFHDDMKIGRGGYGAVYKGVLPSGTVVAVKQLHIKTAQGLDEFLNEVVLITGMKHRNLVNLKGCCLREHQRLLVYEYVDNYDVDQVLLGSRKQLVSWPVRLKICLGIARGLHYLHALAHPRVIHRDIKASNILLDKNMKPQIADFGLALLFPDEQTHIMTIHVAGTKGYLAPEYASLGQLSDKVDVYSFGVLCLEIISGRRNIDASFSEEQVFLSKYARDLHDSNRLLDLVDPTLQLTDEGMLEVQRVINVCLLCIDNAAERRPSMARVVSILQSDAESEVAVLVEDTSGPVHKPRLRLHGYDDHGRNGLDSVNEEEEGSSSAPDGSNSEPLLDPSNELSATVELSEIRGR